MPDTTKDSKRQPSYLEVLNQRINVIFTQDISLDEFSDLVMSGKFPLYGEFDIQSSISRLDAIIQVLETMLSIVRKPLIRTINEEVVKRSELAQSLDTPSFQRTLRDPARWRNKDGEMEPEMVHTYEIDDDLNTYENRFICMLADRIKKELFEIEAQSDRYYFALLKEYQSDAITFSATSFINQLDTDLYPFRHTFSKPSKEGAMLTERLKKARKYLSHVFRSRLYKTVHRYEISPNVMPTNILMHHNLYGLCYRFYKENYQTDAVKQLGDDALYYDFVIGDMIRALNLDEQILASDGPFTYDDEGRIEMPLISFRRSKVVVNIEDIKGKYAFKVSCGIRDKYGRYYGKTSRLIYVKKELSRFTQKETYDDLNELFSSGEYDDYVIVTMSNKTNSYNRIATCTYYDLYSAGVINNVIKSAMLCFTIEKESSSRCPICGADEYTKHGDHYHCLNCESDYSIYEVDGQNYLLIEKMWRT